MHGKNLTLMNECCHLVFDMALAIWVFS